MIDDSLLREREHLEFVLILPKVAIVAFRFDFIFVEKSSFLDAPANLLELPILLKYILIIILKLCLLHSCKVLEERLWFFVKRSCKSPIVLQAPFPDD